MKKYLYHRQGVTCNGRPAFYASIYDDIRNKAMYYGWAIALHGSLASDMDLMAMPWTENACSFENLVDVIAGLFIDNENSERYTIIYGEKPNNRIVASIPIYGDFYLDISSIKMEK